MKLPFLGKPKAEKQARGAILLDGKHVADTLQCVHCSGHWISVTGSGKRRGWCLHCKGPLCGSHRCDICIPFESRLEGWEQRLTLGQVLKKEETKAVNFFLPNGKVIT
jgi:hypothetical protein